MGAKDLGIPTDSTTSPSAYWPYSILQMLLIRRSFKGPFNSAFIPLRGALACPRVEYGMQAYLQNFAADFNHLRWTQILVTRRGIDIRREWGVWAHIQRDGVESKLTPHTLRLKEPLLDSSTRPQPSLKEMSSLFHEGLWILEYTYCCRVYGCIVK